MNLTMYSMSSSPKLVGEASQALQLYYSVKPLRKAWEASPTTLQSHSAKLGSFTHYSAKPLRKAWKLHPLLCQVSRIQAVTLWPMRCLKARLKVL